jgi:hypothetical protein
LERDQKRRDRLHSIFHQLIEEGNKCITVMHFAMATQRLGEDAKQYLDAKAIEFD